MITKKSITLAILLALTIIQADTILYKCVNVEVKK
jgi:hypothetical protein